MTDASSAAGGKAPWHLWLVGVLAVAWNAMGAFDYLMTQTRDASYMASFTAEQLAYIDGFPKWAIATWALGVWGGVLGGILLLLRRRLAVPVFAVSLASAAITFLYNFALSNGLKVMGGGTALILPAAILLIGVLLFVYARRQGRSGVLR